MRVGLVGLGKMGLSHQSMIRTHPDVELAGICDSAGYVLDVLERYTGVKTWSSFDRMLKEADLDAVIIATPSGSHADLVRKALDAGLHVFCEKPFVLDPEEGQRLVELAAERGVVNQVGYHNRFISTFAEVKRLLDLGAIGQVSHVLAESYGPVVLKPKGGTWRSNRSEGGGCLYDYAAHSINLVNWYLGSPSGVGGTVLGQIFSKHTEDEVYSSLYFDGGVTAQLSINWSDESQRKMTTKISAWGTQGRIYGDRQEIQVYLRDKAWVPDGYQLGWNVRYITDLTPPVWFYLRGEEYSAQLDHFVTNAMAGRLDGMNTFASALATDRVIDQLLADASGGPRAAAAEAERTTAKRPRRSRLPGLRRKARR
jgi:predicted dehydrogenase